MAGSVFMERDHNLFPSKRTQPVTPVHTMSRKVQNELFWLQACSKANTLRLDLIPLPGLLS